MSLKDQLAALCGDQVHACEVKSGAKKSTFHFRELSGDEVEGIFQAASTQDGAVTAEGNRELRKRITAASFCNPDGSASDMDGVALAKLPNRIYSQLQTHAMRLNGLLPEESDPKA